MSEPHYFRYPLDAAQRRQLREKHMLRHARQALKVGWSSRCVAGDHSRFEAWMGNGGCQNDGSTCLCWCHDAIPVD